MSSCLSIPHPPSAYISDCKFCEPNLQAAIALTVFSQPLELDLTSTKFELTTYIDGLSSVPVLGVVVSGEVVYPAAQQLALRHELVHPGDVDTGRGGAHQGPVRVPGHYQIISPIIIIIVIDIITSQQTSP